MRNDPKNIWQNQPTETSVMTLETIRRKTEQLRAKTRRALLSAMVSPLFVAAVAGSILAQIGIGPMLQAVFALAIAWSLTGMYFITRGMGSAPLPGDEAFRTGIESYRREVERRRSFYGRFLLWSLGPVLLSLATLIVPLLRLAIRDGLVLNMAPFLSLVVLWIAGVFVIRMRDRRELQQEIDELNEIERANG